MPPRAKTYNTGSNLPKAVSRRARSKEVSVSQRIHRPSVSLQFPSVESVTDAVGVSSTVTANSFVNALTKEKLGTLIKAPNAEAATRNGSRTTNDSAAVMTSTMKSSVRETKRGRPDSVPTLATQPVKIMEKSKTVIPKSLLNFLDLIGEHKWFDVARLLENKNRVERRFASVDEAVAALKAEAQSYVEVLGDYVNRLKTKSDKDEQWLRSVVSKGTSNDRVAAGVLLIQQCPPLQTVQLQRLIEQFGKLNRTASITACEAVKDLMINDLLPPDRKLHFFATNPLFTAICQQSHCVPEKPPQSKRQKTHGPSSRQAPGNTDIVCTYSEPQLLLVWFEDVLKALYMNLVMTLATGCKDSLAFFRQKCVKLAFELLTNSPEQEQGLLSILVSQLVHSRQKSDVNTAVYLLKQVLTLHPPMKRVVTQYVGETISQQLCATTFQPEGLGALYRPVLFLTSFRYSRNDTEYPKFMITILMRIFHLLVEHLGRTTLTDAQEARLKIQSKRKKRKLLLIKKKNSADKGSEDGSQKPIDSHQSSSFGTFHLPGCRLMKVVVNGINRALPYVPKPFLSEISLDSSTLRRLILSVKSNTVKIALLSLLYQMNNLLQQDNSDFFTLLYSALKDFELLQGSNRVALLTLMRGIQSNLEQNPSVPLALTRRLLQTSSQISLPGLQLEILNELAQFISDQFVWSAPILLKTDAQLLQENEEESFVDAPADSDSESKTHSTKVGGVGALCGGSCVSPGKRLGGQHADIQPHKSLRYNPFGSDPRLDRAQLNHLWEIGLLRCSVFPVVAEYANAIYSWGLLHRQQGKEWGSWAKSLLPAPNLDHIIPGYIKPTDRLHPCIGTADVILSGTVLDMLAYRSTEVSEDENINRKKKKENKDMNTASGGCLAMELSSPAFWAKKSCVYPHEKFMHKYFTDGYVTRQKPTAKPQFNTEEDDIEDNDGAGGGDTVNDEDERSMDEFLNNVMAAEMGCDDEDNDVNCSEADSFDEYGELNDGISDGDEANFLEEGFDDNDDAAEDNLANEFDENSVIDAADQPTQAMSEKRRRNRNHTSAVFADAANFSQYL